MPTCLLIYLSENGFFYSEAHLPGKDRVLKNRTTPEKQYSKRQPFVTITPPDIQRSADRSSSGTGLRPLHTSRLSRGGLMIHHIFSLICNMTK